MTKQQAEAKCRDLKTVLDNLRIKHEMKLFEKDEEIKNCGKIIAEKDRVLQMLQDTCVHYAERLDCVEKELLDEKAEKELLRAQLQQVEDRANYYQSLSVKDSTNSGKPPSSDGLKKKKTYSTRGKSDNPIGGQFGHQGNTLTLKEPTEIINKMPVDTCNCGGQVVMTQEYTPKQTVHIRVVTDVIEERSCRGVCAICGKVHEGSFSEGFVNPVQYGNDIKSLVVYLGEYGDVTINKVSEMISNLTNGEVTLSHGTVQNFYSKFASLSEPILEDIKLQLILSGVLNTDETGCRVDGKLNWTQIFTNPLFALYGVGEKRGDFCAELEILKFFTGVLVHDHLVSYYNHTHMTHAECNAHILRYLKMVTEIFQHKWAGELTVLFKDALNLKYDCIDNGLERISQEDYDRISDRFDEIMNQGFVEYENAVAGKENIKYYDEERRLLTRLREYKVNHLLFLTRKDIPFSNNLAETGLAQFKRKLKISGCFRSFEGAVVFAKILSVIQTTRKHNANVYQTIQDVFNGNKPAFLQSYLDLAG